MMMSGATEPTWGPALTKLVDMTRLRRYRSLI
jgi:hypothetical protein